MSALQDRLADLAQDAPSGGAPPAELWARGRRRHRLRTTALPVTALLVLGTVGTSVGTRLADAERASLGPAGASGVTLPIEYPVGADPDQLPALGTRPGQLTAIWLAPRRSGGEPAVVAVVAGSGRFGTLPVDLSPAYYQDSEDYLALSPDGRRLAYNGPGERLVLHDLVSGATTRPATAFEVRTGYTWVDASHLVGHVAAGTDVDGWVWDVLEQGSTPERVDLRTYPGSTRLEAHAGRDPWFGVQADDRGCSGPSVDANGAPVLCDVLGVIGSGTVLTHWRGEVVALRRADAPFRDGSPRRVVVPSGAPERVFFATDLVGRALVAPGGRS